MEQNKAAEMDKVYNPQAIEGELYKEWEENGAFVAHRVEGKQPFTIVMPPPNITGQLHMGHAMDGDASGQPDPLSHVCKGNPTLWLPGTDHASDRDRGRRLSRRCARKDWSKHDVGRDGIPCAAHGRGKKEYGGRIVASDSPSMGNSCDWSRLNASRWTTRCNKAVARGLQPPV